MALLGAAGAVIAFSRDYVLQTWNPPITPTIYLAVSFFVVWVALAVSMRPLLLELRKQPQSLQSTHNEARIVAEVSVHRFSRFLGLLIAAVGLLLIALPYVIRPYSGGYPVGLYIGFDAAACVAFTGAAYVLNYMVTIGSDKLIVRGFRTTEILLDDIRGVKFVKTKGGPQVVVSLQDGKTLRFGNTLTGFSIVKARLVDERRFHVDA